jgi:hypothetical protein
MDDDIARIDADPQFQLTVAVGCVITRGQRALNLDRAIDRVDRAVELDEEAIALASHEPTLVQRHSWLEHGLDTIGEPKVRTFFVGIHQTAVADNIREEDRRQPPLEVDALDPSYLNFPAQIRHCPDSGRIIG